MLNWVMNVKTALRSKAVFLMWTIKNIVIIKDLQS